MDRLTDIDQTEVERLRAEMIAEADSGFYDSSLPDPLDRRNRVRDFGPDHVCLVPRADGSYVPSRLRQNDDVYTNEDARGRVVGPGIGRETFLLYYVGWRGDWTCQVFNVSQILERAPATPGEEPMPVIPPEEPPPEEAPASAPAEETPV